MEGFVVRTGTFFIVIGVGVLILFIASDYANQPNFDYLFWAVLSITIGILLRRRKPPPPPSGRFSMLHKTPKHSKKDDEDEEE